MLGKVVCDHAFYLGVECSTKELEPDIGSAEQNILYSGANNDLIMVQKFKVVYPCPMNITLFPFDKQVCRFILKLETKGSKSVYLRAESRKDAVSYIGNDLLNEFKMKDIRNVYFITSSLLIIFFI